MELTIQGPVERFADISPRRVRLTGPAGTSVTQKVTIVPDGKHAFKITGHRTSKQGDVEVTLEEKEGPEYVLTVENRRTDPARYFNSIYLKTDSKDQPEIKINVYGHIYEDKGKK